MAMGHPFNEMTHADTLDRIYRRQRHFYDATRPLFLFGRDLLLDCICPNPGDRVLEVGCGTGRNLICLARRIPSIDLYGVDASAEMLKTANSKIGRAQLKERITLANCFAEDISPDSPFQTKGGFNRIFFSYSLSMMPHWPDALDAAMRALTPTGTLYILDFWDQGNWPKLPRHLFGRWLELFHVRFDPHMLSAIQQHFSSRQTPLVTQPIAGRYAFLARPSATDPHTEAPK